MWLIDDVPRKTHATPLHQYPDFGPSLCQGLSQGHTTWLSARGPENIIELVVVVAGLTLNVLWSEHPQPNPGNPPKNAAPTQNSGETHTKWAPTVASEWIAICEVVGGHLNDHNPSS